jgi:hypothetical protein
MKQFICYLPTLLVLVAYSCKKNMVTPPKTVNVYVAGDGDGPILWKNDTVQAFDNNNNRGDANSVYVAGNNVYVAGDINSSGYATSSATLWDDGVLNDNYGGNSINNSQYAYGVSVYGSGYDVYELIVGYINYTQLNAVVLYKNHIFWKTVSNMSYCNSLFVSGSDVYITGYSNIGNKNAPSLWKNGTVQTLPDRGNGGMASAVYVSGNDVYVAGDVYISGGYSVATIWKNGVAQTLDNRSSYPYATLSAIYISGNNVYVAGTEYINSLLENAVPTVWKNGVAQSLPTNGAYTAWTNSIAVSGNDVYVAGVEDTTFSNHVAVLWKNGVATTLPNGTQAASVFVTNN